MAGVLRGAPWDWDWAACHLLSTCLWGCPTLGVASKKQSIHPSDKYWLDTGRVPGIIWGLGRRIRAHPSEGTRAVAYLAVPEYAWPWPTGTNGNDNEGNPCMCLAWKMTFPTSLSFTEKMVLNRIFRVRDYWETKMKVFPCRWKGISENTGAWRTRCAEGVPHHCHGLGVLRRRLGLEKLHVPV